MNADKNLLTLQADGFVSLASSPRRQQTLIIYSRPVTEITLSLAGVPEDSQTQITFCTSRLQTSVSVLHMNLIPLIQSHIRA